MTLITASPTGLDTIVSTTSLPSANNVDITDIPATYRQLILHLDGASHDSAGNLYILLRVSTDNGSSFETTGYAGRAVNHAGTSVPNVNSFNLCPAIADAANTLDCVIVLTGYQDASTTHASYAGDQIGTTSGEFTGQGIFTGSSGNIDALRLIFHSGSDNFDGGTYALYGVL